jgi:predicted sulfurtransferase
VESFGTHSEEKTFSPELDWSDCGEEVDALQWHQRLKEKRPQEREVVLLDCRNAYESDVGKFEGAVPLNTGTFRYSEYQQSQ